jgi:PAS domain S-box-containing protein
MTEHAESRRFAETRIALIEYAASHTLDELLIRALDEVGAFVDSPIGFYHFVEPDQKTLSLQQWSTRTRQEFCRAEGKGMHYRIDQAGVWVDCVYEKKPVIHNDYASLPHKKGMPEGHAEVIRELVVPVMREDEVVAILGVGNKPTEYTQTDVEIVSYLADVTWEIVRQKQAEEALRASERKYRNIIQSIPMGMHMYQLEPGGRLVFSGANRAADEILGVKNEQFVGKTIKEAFPPLAETEVPEKYRLAASTGVPWHAEQITYQDDQIAGAFEVHAFQTSPGRMTAAFWDVTERKRAGEALAESHERLLTILDSIDADVYVADMESYEILFMNQHMRASFGEGLVGKVCWEAFRGEPGPCAHCTNDQLLDTDGNPTGVVTWAGQNPITGRWYLNYDRAIKWVDGRVVRLQVATDITEHKRATEALQEGEQFLQDVFDAIQDGISVLDTDLRVVRTNRWMEEMYAPQMPLVGQECYQAYQQRQSPCPWCPTLLTIETGKTHSQVVPYPSAEDPAGWVELSAFPVKDEQGQVTTVIEYVKDITVRVRAERLLHTLNVAALATQRALTHDEIFDAVVREFSRLGFSCMLFLTDENQNALFPKYMSYESRVLRAVEGLVGIKQEDFAIPVESIDAYREVVCDKRSILVEDAREILHQVLPAPVKVFGEQIARMLDIPQFIAAPLIVEDRVIGLLSVQSSDLTREDIPAITAFAHQVAAAWRKASLMQDLGKNLQELQRTQDQLVQAQKMEAIGRLAGGVAHDFNNLLTAVQGYASLLLDSFAAASPQDWPSGPTTRADLGEILKAAERASALTQQLLAFSRKQVLQPRVLSLNKVLTGVEKMLRRLIGEDIELSSILDPGLGYVRADPAQIEQVIMNLSVNARDAMPHGGRLTFETANVVLDETYARLHPIVEPGKYVRLTVSDTGMGMSREVKAHLFEPFFTTKEEGKGTGLGLATVWGIVDQSGGHVDVYSELGVGTTFKVYLPRVDEKLERGEPERPGTALPRGTETILLAEDEAAVRRLARRILEECGYTVLDVECPEDALLVSGEQAGPIHLLVTDVVMPGLGGRELAERLVLSRPEMKVLYISGYTDDAIAHHGVLDPGVTLLEKPFTPDVLARKVREVLDGPPSVGTK